MGIPFPQEYGGGGADTLSYVLAVEELARIDSSVCITMAAHTSLGTMPIYLWGERGAEGPSGCRGCAAGERLASFGLTEPEAGSDAGNVRTTAKLDGGEWTVNGAKQFITNSGTEISGCVSITAVTGEVNGRREISNLIVPSGTPGYEVGAAYRKMGWNASDTRPLSFEDCRLAGDGPARPPRRRLQELPPHPRRRPDRRRRDGRRPRPGRPRRGDRLRQGALRPSARRSPGSSRSRPRSPTSRPRSRRRGLWTWRAALEKDAGKSFTLTAAQAKLITGRLAVRATEEAVQIHGGYGYIEEYPVCRFYRDAKILTIGEGTDEVQQMVIARQLGC